MSTSPVTVTGAGPAGLSLAALLSEHSEVSLIADNLQPNDDKTWCFWDLHVAPTADLIHHQWNQLRIISKNGENILSKPGESSYYCIRSDIYQQYMLEKLRNSSSVSLLEAKITSFSAGTDGVEIETDKGLFRTGLLFQSHSQPDDRITYADERVSLKQHFLGWDIRCKEMVFNKDEAILMDFRTNQDFGFAFVYVLPFSETEALVEVTYFTESLLETRALYELQIQEYLEKNWGLKDASYTVERQEFGVIPMADGFVSATNKHPLYSIGLAGGHAKASTGYAFARIHRDSARIASAISKGERPDRAPLSAARFRFYDLLMLNIIRQRPEHAVTIFVDLFKKNGFKTMFDFLDEKTNLAEEVRIMASVPSYTAFFKSIAQTRKRLGAILNAK
ncbi:MAG: hypothetical protein JJU41_05940 [Bacteroidetes bacterium]|nr:hypothetical protein [Bacteroidota bacterium]MCH8523060.1 hypothetical protein [Balneolales bacterium]